MKKYIGFRMIQAEGADRSKEDKRVFLNSDARPSDQEYEEGYTDGYQSWLPKDIFEKAYMQVGDNNTITQDMVDNFIVSYEIVTQQNKITIVTATLANNFTIVESSACVDPANYNEQIGTEICIDRIKNKIWFLLGFLLQTAKDGVGNSFARIT